MSTERIFGGWSNRSTHHDSLENLWHQLAAQDVNTPRMQPNSGMSQRKAEIIMLWELYRRSMSNVVVEIGTAQGGTFAAWCQLGLPYATLIAIDRDLNDCRPRPGEPVHEMLGRPRPLRFTSDGGGLFDLGCADQRVVAINGWSYEPKVLDELRAVLNGRKIDWLFHDASHAKDMAMRDYELYRPLMAEGSVMAFHDIQKSAHPDCNKSEFWSHIKDTADYSACFEFLGSRTDDSLGVGVLVF